MNLFDLSAERLERLRLTALCVAIGLLAIQLIFDIEWLDWPRGLAWMTAGAVCFLEGRLARRNGEDAAAHYIRGVLLALVGITAIV